MKISDQTIDLELIRRIREISGEDIYQCMQCGTCAGACPLRELADLSPTRIIHLLHLGRRAEAIQANTARLCASCHACEARCPRGIDLPRVMEAIRLLTLRNNENFIEPFELEKRMFDEVPTIALVAAFRKHTA
ncbi:MAG: 4Fe-4S dicluster domain-containing protein [Calditrichota bacterium]